MAQSQYSLPRQKTLTGTDEPGPRAFVVHHTGGGSSAKSIVDYWRANRPGIGTQYIMDRDGVVHNVKDEFGYKGTGHVHPGYTPKDFKDKGLVNKNMLGMEIMAKNDKDVTPKQAKAFAEFMQKNHPELPIYGHGELNPGHREKDEGLTAKNAALALRNGSDPAVASAATTGAASAAVKDGARGPGPEESPYEYKDPSSMRRAFLKSIAKGEAPEGAYDMMLGGQRFKDFSKHPGQSNGSPYGSSTAAGQYQFLKSTWDEQAQKYGYKDFTPDTQDAAAWNYARDTYTQRTGRRLEDDLATNDPKVLNEVSKALSKTWTSLPGGPQPNSNWEGKDFASVYQANLGSKDAGSTTTTMAALNDPTPNVGSGESDYKSDYNTDGYGPSNVASTTTSPGVDASTVAAADTGKSAGAGVGDIFAGLGDIFGKGPVAQNAARSSPANVPAAQQPLPVGATPMFDVKLADAQRQQLALAMQRLNSGKLV